MIKLNITRFGSTNKTTHYELSQFVSSDKPSWLNDVNSDMSKIDTAINAAKTTADGAATAAGNAQTAAETAQGTANTAVTNAATADGKAVAAQNAIGTLANLTTTVKTDVVSAINEVDSQADTNSSDIASIKNHLDIDPIVYTEVSTDTGQGAISKQITVTKRSIVRVTGYVSGWGYSGEMWSLYISNSDQNSTLLGKLDGRTQTPNLQQGLNSAMAIYDVPANTTLTLSLAATNIGSRRYQEMLIEVDPLY